MNPRSFVQFRPPLAHNLNFVEMLWHTRVVEASPTQKWEGELRSARQSDKKLHWYGRLSFSPLQMFFQVWQQRSQTSGNTCWVLHRGLFDHTTWLPVSFPSLPCSFDPKFNLAGHPCAGSHLHCQLFSWGFGTWPWSMSKVALCLMRFGTTETSDVRFVNEGIYMSLGFCYICRQPIWFCNLQLFVVQSKDTAIEETMSRRNYNSWVMALTCLSMVFVNKFDLSYQCNLG